MKKAQDSIQNRLEHFEDKLWVPSREEVIAAREAKEAAAKSDTIVARKDDPTKESVNKSKTSRGSKKPAKKKESKVKESKPKSSSSSATRSVRRRK